MILLNPTAFEQIFNLATIYLPWEEIARMAVGVTGSSAEVKVVPPAEWTGAAFLADRWELDDRRIRERLGFKPSRDPADAREALRRAIAKTWQQLKAASA